MPSFMTNIKYVRNATGYHDLMNINKLSASFDLQVILLSNPMESLNFYADMNIHELYILEFDLEAGNSVAKPNGIP